MQRISEIWKKLSHHKRMLSAEDTPFFLLCEDDLDWHLQNLHEIVKGNSEIFYVYKTNPVKRIRQLAAKHGFGAEVVTLEELKLALKLHKKIIFNGLHKTDEELRLALLHRDKVTLIIDNFDELERIKRISSDRIKAGIRISIKGPWSRFGFTEDELEEVFRAVDVIGLHVHNGIEKHLPYYESILYKFREIILKHELKDLEFVDLGGAFPIGGFRPYNKFDQLAARASLSFQRLDGLLMPGTHDFDYYDIRKILTDIVSYYRRSILSLGFVKPKLFLEPGRLVISPNVYFISRVLNIKRDEIIVDGGYTNLPTISNEKHIIMNLDSTDIPARLNKTRIYGPLPHVADLISRYYYGDPVKKGDLIAISDVGAYYYAMSSEFIRKRAGFYSLSKDRIEKLA